MIERKSAVYITANAYGTKNIKTERDDTMGFYLVDDYKNQALTFNDHTWAQIDFDLNVFVKNKNKKEKKISSLLNTVIKNYMHDAWCSISYHYDEYSSLLENVPIEKDKKDELIKCLIANRVLDPPTNKKGTPKIIYIHKDIQEMLATSDDSEYYDGNIKKYLEALVNEYINLPFYEREKIYYKNEYETIDKAIKEHITLTVQYRNKSYTIRPFLIRYDKSTSYNYVVSHFRDENDEWKRISMRLHHISNIVQNKKSTFSPLSEDEKKMLYKHIDQVGLPYVSDEICEIKLRLTDQGLKNYDMWINQRPDEYNDKKCQDKDEHEKNFYCTKRQIRNYFYKFGKDATIISPEDLREQFINDYKEALKAYE